jgi:hypothetical protein
MTFREYLKSLRELARDYPEKLDCPVIYSHDDEGNEYQKVNQFPALVQIENINEDRFLELTGFHNDTNITFKDCNAIIIN